MPRLRVSAITYLNTAPLMWNFEHGPEREHLQRNFHIDYTLPSLCAQMLADGSADIGIIPVASYTSIENLLILPDIAIASDDAVRSILLVSKVPLEKIGTVALDCSSRSSAALIQVLFAKHWKREARFVPAEPDLDAMLASNDAALLIGDPALKVDRSRYLTWDLAHEWKAFTGRPFVFAFWAVRAGAASEDELAYVAEVFRASRDAGMAHLPEIAGQWSRKLELSPEFITNYLTENIQYSLHSGNVAGMQLFFELAAELKVLPPTPELRFARELEIRNSALRNRF